MNKRPITRKERELQGNAAILSRFGWLTSSTQRKCMVLVFIFLILLFLFRYPIIKWITRLPSPPTDGVGQCEVLEKGQLEIGLVHLTPDITGDSVFVSFSTNLPTNNFISVQYSPDGDMEFETFSLNVGDSGHKDFPHKHSASLLLRSPSTKYFYKITCNEVQSKTYSFSSWQKGNNWSPKISIIAGNITKQVGQLLSTTHYKPSLIAHITQADTSLYTAFSTLETLVTSFPFLSISDSSVTFGPPHLTPTTTQHVQVGPIRIVVLNKHATSALHIRQELRALETHRAEYHWLVVMSRQLPVCPSDDLPWGETLGCQALTNLLVEFKVDFLVVGNQKGYQRSLPLVYAGDSQSQSKDSFSSFIVGLRTCTLSVHSNLTSSETLTLLNLNLDSPGSLCLDVQKLDNAMFSDHFCIKKKVDLFKDFIGQNITYDKGVWLGLVVTLLLVMLLALVFRRSLWLRLCRFLNSDGSLPLYNERLLSV